MHNLSFFYKYIYIYINIFYIKYINFIHIIIIVIFNLKNIKFSKVDDVEHPSWQAQIKGEKLWTLEPPRECHYTCKRLEVIVRSGEISKSLDKR